MKEIDFLPEWYKSGRRRRISYRTQVVGLVGIFVVMLMWNFTASHSISETTAELVSGEPKQAKAQGVSQGLTKIKSKVTELQKKAELIEKIDSKIRVARVLAEISFLIDEKIVLSKVEFVAERFAGSKGGGANRGSAVRVAGSNFAGKGVSPLGDVRFRVVLSGIASDASDVGELICKLEGSPYFCQVVPSYSRNIELKTGLNFGGAGTGEGLREHKESFQVSEFEISCELANYRIGDL